jgi:hypothetical protein
MNVLYSGVNVDDGFYYGVNVDDVSDVMKLLDHICVIIVIYWSSLNERVISDGVVGTMTQPWHHKMGMIIYDTMVSSQNVSQ